MTRFSAGDYKDLAKQLELVKCGDFDTLSMVWSQRGASKAEIAKRLAAAMQVHCSVGFRLSGLFVTGLASDSGTT